MKKHKLVVVSTIVAFIVVVLGICFWVARNQEKQEFKNVIKEETISAKEIKNKYDTVNIGESIDDITKTLGTPVYTESSTTQSGSGSTLYTWGSNNSDEVGAQLTINTQNDKIINKSVSGLYVQYDPNNLISSKKYADIKLNNNFTFNNAVKEFGKPNDMSEYKNPNNDLIQTITWNTNTTGPVGSYMTIVFTNNIATSKNEVGLI